MIVKKLPISADFPSFDIIEKMGEITGFEDNSEPVFYDIETTGLSRKSCFIYLIGAVARKDRGGSSVSGWPRIFQKKVRSSMLFLILSRTVPA